MFGKRQYILKGTTSALAFGLFGLATPAFAQIDEVIVQAQKREEALQSVPIAVTAYDAEALDKQQIDTFSDLQFTTPNVYFTKTFFSGSNFQIRGIGAGLTAASGDAGVGIHVNDSSFQGLRIFETEYYDIERIEILRGPQGTLYGRTATGGTVNLITKKPQLGEFEASADYQYGNFNQNRAKAMVNVPLGDKAAARFAGIYLKRDGFTETFHPSATFDDLDSRDQWSVRGSLRLQPNDRLSIDIVGSYFEEDDSRVRTASGGCDTDPTGVLGCLPTGVTPNQSTNFSATFGGISISELVLGPLALAPFGSIANNPNSPDLRKAYALFEPEYTADETFVIASADYELTPTLSLHLSGNYHESSVVSHPIGTPIGEAASAIPAAVLAAGPQYVDYFAGGIPLSAVTKGSHLGALIGAVDNRVVGVQSSDQSEAFNEQWGVEARLSSAFDSPLNFLIAANFIDYDLEANYYVNSTSLDYFSVVGPLAFGFPAGSIAILPYFGSESFYGLQSTSVFGELYFQAHETLKFTAGLRWNQDEKSIRARSLPLISQVALGGFPSFPLPSDALGLSVLNNDLFLSFTGTPTRFDADGSTACDALTGVGCDPWQIDDVKFEEITGRLVVDWLPNLSFTDDTLVYASYARGYKGGGFNPPITAVLSAAGVPATFEPEFINALEVGTKNTLFNSHVQANLTAFYYDYEGYQISRIAARTAINDNIDAKIWGVEGEFLFAPDVNWLFNLTVSYLNTEAGEKELLNSRDPTNGEAGHVVVKDWLGQNCVVLNTAPGAFTATTGGLIGLLPFPLNLQPAPVTTAIPGLTSPGAVVPFPLSCSAGSGLLDVGFGAANVVPGIPVQIEGNQLPYAPEWKYSLGGQYTRALPNNLSLVARTDYTWQDEAFAKLFNDPRTDIIEAWQIWNAQLTLYGPDEKWYLRGYVQNILDDDNITFHSDPTDSTGLGTAFAILDPRIYGLELGIRF